MPDIQQAVLFYDSDCGICKKSMKLLASWDRRRVIRFEPLAGDLAASIGIEGPNFDSIVYWRRNHPSAPKLKFSSATLAALRDIGGLPRILGMIGWFIPRPIRDAAYRSFARHRRHFSNQSCSLND